MTTSQKSITAESRFAALLEADSETLARVDGVLFRESNAHSLDIPRPLSIAEAARMLGKSRTTIHRWLNQNTIRAVRVEGGNRLIPFNEVARLAGAEK